MGNESVDSALEDRVEVCVRPASVCNDAAVHHESREISGTGAAVEEANFPLELAIVRLDFNATWPFAWHRAAA